MLNTSSCTTRHLTLPFPTVNSSSTTEQDYDNFSNLYGNLCSTDNCSVGEEMLDDFFPQEFYNNSQLNFIAEGCLRSKTDSVDNFDAPRASNMAASPESLPQITEKNDEEVPATAEYDIGVCNSSSDGGCEPFTNSVINSNNVADTRRSPGTCKQSAEELMLSVGSQGNLDIEKRKAMPGGPIAPSSRGKGRPVKSAQNPSTSSGCKPLIQCFTCHKTFNNSSALAKHKLIHSDDRKYSCAICSKSFKRQDHLHGHMMTHSAKKPYECCFARCDKSYCDARSLRRHHENHHFQLMESGQRDLPLNSGDGKTFDPSAFKDTNHWTTGFNPLDEPKPVKCSVCGKRFRNLPALNGHMRLHGGYMRQVKSEMPDASDVEKDVISESLETSCASLSSDDANLDQPASKSDHFNNMSAFMPGSMNIKQEFSNEHYWNTGQNWCNNDIKYPNSQMPISISSSSCSNDSMMACFYSAGQSAFQNEGTNSGLIQEKAVPAPPHPSLSSPCLAVSPPSTPGHLKQCYTNAPYNTKYYRRAVTPICRSNVVNSFANKCQQTVHRNLAPQNANLQRTTSAVFPQGHPHSPFSSGNYTPASATTSNFFQFPPSYEDISPPTSQNLAHLSYTHQYPNTSPFLNIQSRPRTPYTPNTPGRSCRQFYYNHGEESPVTPNMRGYGHKTYHPYHSNYRYYQQLKHHNSIQSFPNVDSEFNKCLEMLEKGNIDNMSQSKVNAVGGSAGHFGTNLKQVDAMMDYASGSSLPGIDLNCLAEEASFCTSMDENHSAEWTSGVDRPVQSANDFDMAGATAKNDLQNPVFHGNSSYVPQGMKSCDSFNNLNSQITNNNNSALTFKEAVPGNNSHINHFSVNFDFSHPQNQQNSFGSSMHMGTDHQELASLSMDPSTPTNEKRKKKHKPQPLWIPANVSNFANTGGCFVDQSNECERPLMTNCRKKAPPPPYICITPVSAAPCQNNLSLDPQNNRVLPNSAPPFHDFSMEMSDSMSSGLNGY